MDLGNFDTRVAGSIEHMQTLFASLIMTTNHQVSAPQLCQEKGIYMEQQKCQMELGNLNTRQNPFDTCKYLRVPCEHELAD